VRHLRHKEEISKRSRNRILKAACKLFVDKGFAGTSLGDIAKKINVNQSLIYHYFSSKEELWQSVKTQLLSGYIEASRSSFEDTKGLRFFLENYLRKGFDYFRRHPEVVRILSWQSLEGSSEKTASIEMFDQELLMNAFVKLQRDGEIRADIDPLILILMLRNALRAPFFDDYASFDKIEAHGGSYVTLATESLFRAFKE
jgi:AcrR family transcriptional regulator